MAADTPSVPARPADLNDEAVRRQLGPAGWKAAVRLMEMWQVPLEESRQLLGLPTMPPLDDLASAQFSEELMLRLSYLIGIYKGLHILHTEQFADE